MQTVPLTPLVAAPIILAAFALAPLSLHADDASTALAERGALAVIGLGFLLGLKHAFDADHLVAVSALVSERSDLRRATRIGALWGLGHTTSLLVVGGIMMFVRAPIPEQIAQLLELLVGVMIVGLGTNVLVRLRTEQGARLSIGAHSHGAIHHRHPHVHVEDADERHRMPKGRRPFLVGAFHGLAGSAALTLLVLAEIRTPVVGIAYIVLFGVGSLLGMAAVSSLFALPMSLLARRFRRFDLGLRAAAGSLSVAFGVYLVLEIALVEGLMLAR